jgi:hypothetical protein
MDEKQFIFNIAIGISSTLLGWWMKVMWESLKELQKDDKELASKVSSIEILVAGNYVKREDLTDLRKEIKNNFDYISSSLNTLLIKVENKADK